MFALNSLQTTSHAALKSKLDESGINPQNFIRGCHSVSPLALGSSGEQIPEEYPINVLFDGLELRAIVGRTSSMIELRNDNGRCCQILSSAEALDLDLDLFVGIGNRRRIRFLRWRTRKFAVNAGSHTTQRLRGEAGVYIAHPLVREHRTLNVRDDKIKYHSEV
jgi:hypothetical protein